jgi:uncharacterized protein (TIGR03086 family)
MDGVAMLQRVVDATDQVVNGVKPDQLSAPTPCEEWTVKDILNHIAGGATYFAMSAEGEPVSDELMGKLLGGGDNLGDDPKGAWSTAGKRAIAAFNLPGVMEKTVSLPFGDMPGAVALNIAIFDVATHACDLAHATGQSVDDTDMLEGALAMGKQMDGPAIRQPGVIGDEQPAPADAPIDKRLLAFAGRKV